MHILFFLTCCVLWWCCEQASSNAHQRALAAPVVDVSGKELIVEGDTTFCQSSPYCWLTDTAVDACLASRVGVPEGFARVDVVEHSFAAWLRGLPVLPEGSPVLLFNGSEKINQRAQFAVLNIDVGNRDLQQCADAVMRLRAEYLFSEKRYSEIHFNYTSGDVLAYDRWCKGERLIPAGRVVKRTMTRKINKPENHAALRTYLDEVFNYAGTLSLSRELKKTNADSLQIGDVFIRGGTPGHAVLVVDMIVNKQTKEKRFMLVQSYMPAQQIHLLKNPTASERTPWYPVKFGTTLETPEWDFARGEAMRF